jgi:hypothetical protein
MKPNKLTTPLEILEPHHRNYEYLQKVNGEMQSYLIRVRDKAAEKVKKQREEQRGHEQQKH